MICNSSSKTNSSLPSNCVSSDKVNQINSPRNSSYCEGKSCTSLASFTLLIISVIVSVTLLIPPVNCGIMSRSGKDDKKCMPEIVAIKKTRIVPVAVPIKSMSGPNTVTTYTEEIVADPKDIYKPKEKPKEKEEKEEKPSKYEEDDEHESAVAEAPVYSADEDEEEDEEHYEEDSGVTENVDGGSAYTVSGGGGGDEEDEYKRRKDQLTTTPKPKHRPKRQVTPEKKKKKKSNRYKHKNKSHLNKVKVSNSLSSPFSSDGANKIRGVIRESLTAILSQTRGHLDAALSRSFVSPIPLRPPIDFLPSKSNFGQNFFDKIRKVSSRVTQNYYPSKDLDDWSAEEIAGIDSSNDAEDATSRESKSPSDPDSYADQQESREITKILSSFPQSDRLLIDEGDESEF